MGGCGAGAAGLEHALERMADGDHDAGAEAFGGDDERQEAENRPDEEAGVDHPHFKGVDPIAGDVGADALQEFGITVNDAGNREIGAKYCHGRNMNNSRTDQMRLRVIWATPGAWATSTTRRVIKTMITWLDTAMRPASWVTGMDMV